MPRDLCLQTGPDMPVDGGAIEEARQFASQHIAPDADMWEVRREPPVQLLREAAKRFAPLVVPRELGGKGASFTTFCCVLGELARADVGFACAFAVHCNVTLGLSNCDTAVIRGRHLPDLMTGRSIGAFLLTEPDVGSDATAISATATPQEGDYVLDGTKAWVTNAAFADVLGVYMQTEPGSRAKGVAAFVLDTARDGVAVGAPYDTLGAHAMGTADVVFSGCRIPGGFMIAPPGEGFRRAMRGIDVARVAISFVCNGALQGGLEHLLSYVSQRSVFGKPVAGHQGMQWKLAEEVTRLEASRQLAFRAAGMMERGENATLIAAHAKKLASRTVFDGLASAMQMMGAVGLRRDHPLARQLSGCRVTEYMDGTSDIQNIVIARALLAD